MTFFFWTLRAFVFEIPNTTFPAVNNNALIMSCAIQLDLPFSNHAGVFPIGNSTTSKFGRNCRQSSLREEDEGMPRYLRELGAPRNDSLDRRMLLGSPRTWNQMRDFNFLGRNRRERD